MAVFEHRLLFAPVLLAALVASGSARAEGQSGPQQGSPEAPPGKTLEERLQRTEARIAEQDAAIARLRDEGRRQRDELARLESARAASAKKEGGSLLDALRFSGFIQADAVIFRQSSRDEIDGATGAPLNTQRFVIPRARLRADFDRGPLAAALELDANTIAGPTARIIDAEITARFQGRDPRAPPYLAATVGLIKIPFGLEVPQSDTSRLFLERSTVVRALFPGSYDLGVRLHGGYRFLRYSAAVMNGDPLGEKGYGGLDLNAGKDVLARLGADTRPIDAVRVEVGLNGLTGQGLHRGTPTTKDVLVWRDANEDGLVQSTEIQAIPGAAATPSATFRRFALAGDLRITATLPVLGDLTLYGEVIRSQNLDRGLFPADPVGIGRDVRELGFYAGLTQEITRWAMVGLRYDRYDPDADASVQQAKNRVPSDSSFSTIAVTAAFRWAPARVIVEYDHNHNALGRSAGGLPTTLGDDLFAARAEVTF
jgi:hypothetical protein